jgi:hypothetical protein
MSEGDKREEVEANGLWGPKKVSNVYFCASTSQYVSFCLCWCQSILVVLVLVSMFTFAC